MHIYIYIYIYKTFKTYKTYKKNIKPFFNETLNFVFKKLSASYLLDFAQIV